MQDTNSTTVMLVNEFNELVAKLQVEFASQLKRRNLKSEQRSRKLLLELANDFRPKYRDATLSKEEPLARSIQVGGIDVG